LLLEVDRWFAFGGGILLLCLRWLGGVRTYP
jgi:hypothetical protein